MKAVFILYLEEDGNLSMIIDGQKADIATALVAAGKESDHIKQIIENAVRQMNTSKITYDA